MFQFATLQGTAANIIECVVNNGVATKLDILKWLSDGADARGIKLPDIDALLEKMLKQDLLQHSAALYSQWETTYTPTRKGLMVYIALQEIFELQI